MDTSGLPEWVEGGEYPTEASGWQKMTLRNFDMQAKERRVWIKIGFGNDNGGRADLSQNLFTKPDTDGEKKANQITFGKLKQLWQAAGLTDSDYPAPNPQAIAKALNAYEGRLQLDVFCGLNDRGYTEAKRFRRAASAEA